MADIIVPVNVDLRCPSTESRAVMRSQRSSHRGYHVDHCVTASQAPRLWETGILLCTRAQKISQRCLPQSRHNTTSIEGEIYESIAGLSDGNGVLQRSVMQLHADLLSWAICFPGR